VKKKQLYRSLSLLFIVSLVGVFLLLWANGYLAVFRNQIEVGTDKDDASYEEKADEGISTVKLTDEQKSLIEIESEPAVAGSIKMLLPLTGEVTLDQDRLAEVTCPVAGVIKEVSKRLGDHVGKGETLGIVESRELAEAKADYLAATAKAALTQTAYNREKGLWEKKISAQEDYLDAKQSMEEAQIAVRLSRQKLLALGLSPDEIAQVPRQPDSSSGLYPIRAPIDGWIIARQAALGDNASEKELYTICDLSTVWIEASAYTENIASIQTGQEALVQAKAYPGKNFSGAVTWIAPSMDEATRTLKIRIDVENPNLILKEGMFVDVDLEIGMKQDALVIPQSAVTSDNAAAFVFIEAEEGTYEKRTIKLGASAEGQLEVLEGLRPGERVVTKGVFSLDSELKKGSFADED
jgi:cobalt-zinc-cadmium efflux system membrane fusion protein